MTPTDDLHANDDLEVITRAIHDVRLPLTILSARAQLLTRRIEHGRIHDPYTCLGSLEFIRRAAQELEARLHDLEQIVCGCEAGYNLTKSPQDM